MGQNDTAIGEQLTALGQNDKGTIGARLPKLGQNGRGLDKSLTELQTTKSLSCRKGCQRANVKEAERLDELEQGGGTILRARVT